MAYDARRPFDTTVYVMLLHGIYIHPFIVTTIYNDAGGIHTF